MKRINRIFIPLAVVMTMGVTSCTKKDVNINVGQKLSHTESNQLLADSTGGKTYTSSGDVGVLIESIIRNELIEPADVAILVDNTGSMGDEIDEVNANISGIVAALYPGSRLAGATFNDRNVIKTSAWYDNTILSSDYSIATNFFAQVRNTGGGGERESTYDGIWETASRLDWFHSKRMIIVIGDAPPHYGDKTKYELLDVQQLCRSLGIELHMVKV